MSLAWTVFHFLHEMYQEGAETWEAHMAPDSRKTATNTSPATAGYRGIIIYKPSSRFLCIVHSPRSTFSLIYWIVPSAFPQLATCNISILFIYKTRDVYAYKCQYPRISEYWRLWISLWSKTKRRSKHLMRQIDSPTLWFSLFSLAPPVLQLLSHGASILEVKVNATHVEIM